MRSGTWGWGGTPQGRETNWVLKEWQRRGLPWGGESSDPCNCQLPGSGASCGAVSCWYTDKSQDSCMEWKPDKYMLQTTERKSLEELNDWKLGSVQRQESHSETCNQTVMVVYTIQTAQLCTETLRTACRSPQSYSLECFLQRPWWPSRFGCCKRVAQSTQLSIGVSESQVLTDRFQRCKQQSH